MWGCTARFIGEKILIPIVVAVLVELVLDKYRKPKAQIHFSEDWKEKRKREKEVLLEGEI